MTTVDDSRVGTTLDDTYYQTTAGTSSPGEGEHQAPGETAERWDPLAGFADYVEPEPTPAKVPTVEERLARRQRRQTLGVYLGVAALTLTAGAVQSYHLWWPKLATPEARPAAAVAPPSAPAAPPPVATIDSNVATGAAPYVTRVPPSALSDRERRRFVAENLVDGDLSTAWRARGDQSGQEITLSFEHPMKITSVGLVNGAMGNDPETGEPLYPQHRRVTEVLWKFDNGAERTQYLHADRARMQSIYVGAHTTNLTVQIKSTSEPGVSNDTVISEIQVLGQPCSEAACA